MRIPESFIQEVLLRNPLEELVNQYSPLKRAGSNLVCCCPFHNEKTPSFTLYSNPSHFYCYGCGAGGDAITFVRRMENLDYVAAVEFLANRAGLPMPVSDPLEKRVNKKRFYEMNAEAARFWHSYLMTPEGKPGLDYLQKRGLSLAVIKRFGLGYAPDDFHCLHPHLQKLGYREEEIKEAFLGGYTKNGKFFDYFRGRAVFPVIDVSGNVVAFSGRQVAPMGENDRKYVNTSDTPVYKKSQTVFALNLAKNYPGRELVLCEGNMDAVSLHAHGVTNAVASLGTALTPAQCRLLARYAETIFLCYDSDKAGKAATLKAIRLLTEAGLKVRVMELDGINAKGEAIKDPDDFIRSFGEVAFEKKKKEAKGAIEYQFAQLLAQHELDTMDGKNAFIKDCIALLATVQSPLEKELFLGKASELTGIPVGVIRTQTTKEVVREFRREEKKTLQKELQKSQGIGNRVNPDKAKFSASAAKEENILGLLLLRPEYLTDKKIRDILNPQLFSCDFSKRVLQFLLSATEGGEDFTFSRLNEAFSPEEIGEMEGLKKKREALGNNSPQILTELFDRLAKEEKKKELGSQPLSTDWLEKLKAEKTGKETNT